MLLLLNFGWHTPCVLCTYHFCVRFWSLGRSCWNTVPGWLGGCSAHSDIIWGPKSSYSASWSSRERSAAVSVRYFRGFHWSGSFGLYGAWTTYWNTSDLCRPVQSRRDMPAQRNTWMLRGGQDPGDQLGIIPGNTDGKPLWLTKIPLTLKKPWKNKDESLTSTRNHNKQHTNIYFPLSETAIVLALWNVSQVHLASRCRASYWRDAAVTLCWLLKKRNWKHMFDPHLG